MDFFDLVNISERYQELINPSSTEKVLRLGKILGLREGSRVIEFGSGFGEILAIWAKAYGITGVGIELREYACDRSRKKMDELGLADKIETVHGKGAEYKFEERSYDVAACIGATFVFGDYRKTIQAMSKAIKPEGKLAIGEPYWQTEVVPPKYAKEMPDIHTRIELLEIAHEEGFDIEYSIPASRDDWARYEAENWFGLVRWLEENKGHPEFEDVLKFLRKNQEEYFRYGRQYMGWAMFSLNPIKY